MKRLSTPVPSQVTSVSREIERIAKTISKDYRDTLDDIRTPYGGASEVQIAKTSFSNPTYSAVANNEGRLRALGEGYLKMEDALASLRSAHGLIARAMDASKHESKGSNYTAKEMEEMEARARDANPRGMKGGRVAVRSIR
jgi:hypothetical protein